MTTYYIDNYEIILRTTSDGRTTSNIYENVDGIRYMRLHMTMSNCDESSYESAFKVYNFYRSFKDDISGGVMRVIT